MKEGKYDHIPIHFIVGSARSGTTLLSMMLNQAPPVVSATENDFLLYFLHDYRYADLSDTKIRSRIIAHFIKRSKRIYPIWNIDNDLAAIAEQGMNGVQTYTDFCKWVYMAYGKKNFGKVSPSVIVNKNPVYTLHLRELMDHFPESKFIALVRDYRDVIISQKRFFGLLKLMPVYSYVWTLKNEIISDCIHKHPDRIKIVKYEDLVLNPEKELQNICGFLNIGFVPEMLNYHKNLSCFLNKISDHIGNTQKKRLREMFSLIAQPVTGEQVGAGLRALSKPEIRTADLLAGKTGARFGYLPVSTAGMFAKIFLRLYAYPILVLTMLQMRIFKYYYYYIPIGFRNIFEVLNISLIIQRIAFAYKNRQQSRHFG